MCSPGSSCRPERRCASKGQAERRRRDAHILAGLGEQLADRTRNRDALGENTLRARAKGADGDRLASRTIRSPGQCSRARRSSRSTAKRTSSGCIRMVRSSPARRSRIRVTWPPVSITCIGRPAARSGHSIRRLRCRRTSRPRLTNVPYIVRLETGTINRAIYQTAILDNPALAGPDLRNQADPGWNGRLVYTFGGGCGGGHYIQGATPAAC